MKFAERVTEELEACGKTQKEVAQALHISEGNISNWKSGVNIPSLDLFYSLCIYLNVSADYLLGLDEIIK